MRQNKKRGWEVVGGCGGCAEIGKGCLEVKKL